MTPAAQSLITAAARVLSGKWPKLFCRHHKCIAAQRNARHKRWANPYSEITINPTGKGAK